MLLKKYTKVGKVNLIFYLLIFFLLISISNSKAETNLEGDYYKY